jgi:hypothetical protein
MRVTGDVDRPGEGLYQLRGTVGGRTVDVTWELYADALEERAFAAFIRGSWYDGQVDGSVEGFFGVVSSNPASFEATFTTVADTVAGVTLWMFQGARASPGTSFTVSVRGSPANGPLITGSLSAVQLTGPGAQGASRGGPDVRRRRP